MSLTLKIQIVKTNQLKAMKFAPTMSVSEACAQIQEKLADGGGGGGEDHGLFQPAGEGKKGARWLRMDRTLQYYDLKMNDTLEYKKKHRPLKVKLLDETIKTVIVDDSSTVEQLVEVIGKKMNIKNFEEFSLQVDGRGGEWLNGLQSLQEQGVAEDQVVVLKKKFFVDDANISRDDPVQLHLVYVQSRDAITSGTHPCTYDESVQFAALQCQIQLGNHNPAVHKPGYLRKQEYLPPSSQKNKNAEKDILNEYRKLVGMSEVNAKYRYVQLCRSLKTYGITFFKTKERVKGQKKLVPKLLGITRDSILRLDAETKEVEHEYPLTHLRRWAASPASFTLDFGDYEEEYVSVVTNEGESISQLLAGYIDILLKKRKDTGAVLEEAGSEIGTVETQGRVRGQVNLSITTSQGGMLDSHQGRESQFQTVGAPMARRGPGAGQGLQVTDVNSAQTAISNFINELDAQPLPVPGAVSHFSPQQWRQQLTTQYKGVAAAAGKLQALGIQPQNIDRTALNNVAKELAMTVDTMLSTARNAAASEGEQPDGEMPLLDGAKALADAVAKMLKVTKDLANNPADSKAKDAFKQANEMLTASQNLLNGALLGNLADIGTSRLIAESAKAVAVASNGLLATAKAVADDMDLDDPSQHKLLNVATLAQTASQNCLAISQTLAPAVLDPSCKRIILDSAKAVQSANAQLLAAYQTLGTDLEGVGLNDAARAVSEAIAQLMGSTEVAEPRVSSDPDFSDAARAITENTAMLVGAQGNVPVILNSSKAINEAAPLLLAGAKRAAQKTEDEGQKQRLLQFAKQVADAVKGLTELASVSAASPDDPAAFARLQESAQKLSQLTNQLVGDAGKEAALHALRANAKQAAAATTALVAAARTASSSIEVASDGAPLLAAAKLAADTVAKLIKPLQDTQKAADASPEAIATLLNTAKQVAPIGYKLVAASKQAAPHISSKAKKEDLIFAANVAGEALKQLAASTANAAGVGDNSFDQAIEQFQAMVADLESATLDAQSGLLEPNPAGKDNALELMNLSVQRLGVAAKNLVQARNTPDQLGPRANDLANAVQQVVNSGKAIAGATANRALQRSILTATKNVASQSEALVGTARALSSNPKDQGLSQAMSNAAKAVIDAVSQFTQAAKSADPAAKDLEEALNAVKQSEALLHQTPVKTNGDFAALSDKLLSSTKAVSAAVAQLIQARNNPNEVGGLARSIATIVPELVAATNAVAGTAPNKETAQGVINSTKVLTGELANLLQAARQAAAKGGSDTDAEGSNLNNAAKSVGEALRDLLSRLERTTPAQKEIAASLQDVRDAIRKLTDPFLSNLNAPLEGITQAATGLGDAVAQLISARDNPERMSESARKAAEHLDGLVENAKVAAASVSGQIKEPLPVLAKSVQDAALAVANISSTPNLTDADKKKIMPLAKNAALATSALVASSRELANTAKPSDTEDQRIITSAAQAVAAVTSKLVNYAKSAGTGTPVEKRETQQALHNLSDAIQTLNSYAIKYPPKSQYTPGTLTSVAADLIAATRATGNATSQLLEVSGKVAGGAKDTPTFSNLSAAAKSVTSGIQSVMNAANGLKPGQKELDEAIEAIQTASMELDSAALNAAIGLLENTAPPGTTLQKAQNDLVEAAKDVANGAKELMTAIRTNPDKLGAAAKATGLTAPKLATVAKQCAGLTTDNAVQQEQLAAAKALTDGLLEVMAAAKKGDMNELNAQAKNVSQAIAAVITPIKGGVLGSKEADEAMANIRQALGDLGKPIKPSKPYLECQAGISEVARSLASSLNNLQLAAKNKPEDVGVASKRVAQLVPDLIELTRLAAAVTTDAEAKRALPEGTREIVNAALQVINDAKLVSADRKNPQLQNALAASFKGITSAMQNLNAAMKATPTAEKEVDRALDDVARTMADLDTAALFAAAGQLEADTTSFASLEAAQAELLNVAKGISQLTTSIVDDAERGTPESLGAHAKGLAGSLGNLSRVAKVMACIAGDSVSQQSLLTSARTCSISGQQLVLAARKAQKSHDPTDQTALSGSASAMSEAVNNLIQFAQTASAATSQGIVELENAAVEIRKMLGNFDHAFAGLPHATAEDIVNAAKSVAEATALLVSACNNEPEHIAANAKATQDHTKKLLQTSKGAIHLTDDPVIQSNLLEAAKAVANSTVKLVSSARHQRADAQNPAAQQKLSVAAGDVIDTIEQVVSVAGDLPGGERAKKLYAAGENLEETAERELQSAARAIEDATKVLLQAKKEAQMKREQGDLTNGVSEAILDAARAIAQATSVLVHNATVCQKEIVTSGKASKTNNVYRRDPTWARGLISAAQAVAGAVQILVGNASSVVEGEAAEEKLVAAAKGVAGATARLVSASRAKADPMSQSQQKLSGAAKSVAKATSELVEAAKSVGELAAQEEEVVFFGPGQGVHQRNAVIEKQEEILRLQKQLELAQKQLHSINKQEYANTSEPSPQQAPRPASKPAAKPAAKPGAKLPPRQLPPPGVKTPAGAPPGPASPTSAPRGLPASPAKPAPGPAQGGVPVARPLKAVPKKPAAAPPS